MEKRNVYLDNNATTRVDERVVEYMNQFHLDNYAVASSQFSHTPGIRAKEGVERAREIILNKLNAQGNKVVFTSGSEESNNLALKGVVSANKNQKRKIRENIKTYFALAQKRWGKGSSGFPG